MRKAKRVEVPDRVLTLDEFRSLRKQAYNSASWQAEKFFRSSRMIESRLRDKGFGGEGVVYTDENGTEVFCDIPSDVVRELSEMEVIRDRQFCQDEVSRLLSSGKSKSYAKDKLREKKFSDEDIDEAIAQFEEDRPGFEDEALDDYAYKTVEQASFMKLDERKRRDRFLRRMVSQRFNMSDCYQWMNEHEEFFK